MHVLQRVGCLPWLLEARLGLTVARLRFAAPLRSRAHHELGNEFRQRVAVETVGEPVRQSGIGRAQRLGVEASVSALYLGHTEAAVVAVQDLREGDVLRLEDGQQSEDAGSEVDAGASATPSSVRTVLRLLLTLIIFVVLEESFQKWVFRPFFRPDLVDSPMPKVVDLEQVSHGRISW